MNIHVPRVRELWIEHQRQIRELVQHIRETKHQQFSQLMQQRLQQEIQEEDTIFKERAKELDHMKKPGYIQAMQREIARQKQKLLQPALFEEIQQEQLIQQQHMRDLEWQLEHSHIERMKQLVMQEQQRILKKVLPKRYALATVDVQPLTVEYVVRSTGKERR